MSFNVYVHTHKHTHRPALSPAPSLGRRQSQCWGVYLGCSCGLSGQFSGRKALRSWPASLRVPSGRQRSPAIYIGFIPFPSTGPSHPTERKSQLHSLCPPKTICYGTHMSTHHRVNTHKHTHAHSPSLSSRHTPTQQGSYSGTLSVPVGAAPGSRY